MSLDKLTLFESHLNSIQAGITTLNVLMKPENDNSEKQPLLTASKVFIESFDSCFANMGNIYKKYYQEIVNSGTQMVNSLNDEFSLILHNINNVHKELDQYKKDGDTICNVMNDYKKRNHKEPRFCFKNNANVGYKIDIELVKKYPGSYFMELYKDPSMWMDNGDIYIDHNDDNYESILKYMKNDESLIEELKKMDSKKRKEFVNDLDFMSLPVKVEYMNELCFDEDKMKMEAWKKRVIMINGKNVVNLNKWLKKNELFDTVFDKNTIDTVKYFRKNNIMYVNMNLKYGDCIEDYCKNGEIDNNLKELDGNNHNIHIFKEEIKKIGIVLDDNKMKKMMKCLDDHLFTKLSSIIIDEEFDFKLQEWLGYQYQWKLIYKASEHNYTGKSFHEYCDDKGPTLIIIKSSEGWLFGGYTSKSWNGNSEVKDDSNAFIYTLKNPHNVPPTKYNKRKEINSVIYCYSNYGPVFCGGNGCDILISDDCNQSNSCSIYNDGKRGYECDSQYRSSLYVNTDEQPYENKFSVSDYEIYSINNYDSYLKNTYKCGELIYDYINNNKINIDLIPKDFNEYNLLCDFKNCDISLNSESQTQLFTYFYNPSNVLLNSHILDCKYDQYINEFMNHEYKWKLLYRSSEHEYTAKSFHEYCDDKGPTLIIIKSKEGWIFGGYTTKSWSGNYEFKDDSNAFIFTFKNPHNVAPVKYNKRKESKYAIGCDPNYGPVFYGNGNSDIHISNNCNQSNSCSIYNDGNSGYECNPSYYKSLFVNTAGPDQRNKFTILDYEVYTIDK